ncbi:MAG: trehalose-6-phosphate synthase [Candidatus Omnitrophota bacterium]
MKKFFLFIFPILVVTTVVFSAYGFFQVRFEEERLLDDLNRKSRAVAEGMELSVKNILLTRNDTDARYLVEKFQNRERRQGCIIYNSEGEVFAVTQWLADWRQNETPYIREILLSNTSRGTLKQFAEFKLYSYILPITDGHKILGAVEIINDTSFVFARLMEIWKRICISLIIFTVLIILVVSVILRQTFFLPIQRMTVWFHRFQKGETDKLQPFVAGDALGKLASEVEQVALKLRVARKTVTREAQTRLQKEDAWTEDKLSNLVQAKMGENALVIVSNREPYMHVVDKVGGEIQCIRPASGVVSALDPILRACGGTWVAQGSGNADKKFVNSKDKLGVPPEDNRYILKRVWLSKEEEEGYYYGFSNEGLWPLCHITHTRPVFRESDWQMYKKVNKKFADSILEELPREKPYVFIQDYHFTLLAKYIKEKRPDAMIAIFWHIPWPNPEVFSICPYQKEILDGMLNCDLIGFHVQFHCNNFLETANRVLESRVDSEKFSVVRANHETFVRALPISVDPLMPSKFQNTPEVIAQLKKDYDLEDKIIFLGVERIDYTKGIIERMHAIDRFLEKYPQHKDKFVFIQLGAPSRTLIKHYHDLIGQIDQLVEKINWKHSNGAMNPIIYLKRYFSIDEVFPFYALADVCVVSSLHDGMNLVAKEFVTAKPDLNGVLILSCFTGASRELTDAISVNPYSTEEFADAINLAIEMPVEEKQQRMHRMLEGIKENNVYRWAGSIINELSSLKKE